MAENTNNQLVLNGMGMDLEQTLFCGQSFSWVKSGEVTFEGVAGTHVVNARTDGENIVLTKPDNKDFTQQDEKFWHHYFALDVDYPNLLIKFCTDPTLSQCVDCAPGIRVLNQPFFDTLLSFIISQNNHIPRITGIVQRLRDEFGPELECGRHGFPQPETLAKLEPEDLAPLRAGFRARYLIDAARKVASGEVTQEQLAQLDDVEAQKLLKKIVGVGDKVADCVLLFSQSRYRVAPMDVWMKRAMAQCFPDGMPPQAEGSEGIAQQYIFWWARENL